MTKKLKELKKHLYPGRLYRRAELARFSNAVDRHLRQLQDAGVLKKVSGGMYLYPKKTAFGNAPTSDEKVVSAFLKEDKFLLCTPNWYTSLNVGVTQLYNTTVVYNHRRHGKYELGGRVFDFRVKHYFPSELSEEFLLVDLVDNVNNLAEDSNEVLEKVRDRVKAMENKTLLSRIAREYGKVGTKKFFENLVEKRELVSVS